MFTCTSLVSYFPWVLLFFAEWCSCEWGLGRSSVRQKQWHVRSRSATERTPKRNNKCSWTMSVWPQPDVFFTCYSKWVAIFGWIWPVLASAFCHLVGFSSSSWDVTYFFTTQAWCLVFLSRALAAHSLLFTLDSSCCLPPLFGMASVKLLFYYY